ncbi:MAG: ABC transporter ATP-binding protein [bacterium]|nr:ABC transporter ATP-binding protein [bacterium]
MAQSSNSNKSIKFSTLKKVLNLTVDFKKKIWIAISTTILLALLSPIRPWLIEKAINQYAAMGDLNGLITICFLILALIIVSGILQFFNEYITGWIAQNVVKKLRLKVFSHLLESKLSYHDKTPVGTMVTRAVTDIETLAELFAEGLITIIGDILQIITITIFMLIIDWKLTLVSLSVLPLLFYASHLFRIKIKSAFEDVRTAVAKLNTFVQEHLTGMQLVQIFNQEKSVSQGFDKINTEHYKANDRSVLYYSIFFPVIEVITSISLGLLVWWGTRQIVGQQLFDFGTITAFILYINMFFRPIRVLADRFNNIQMGIVAADRIFKLLENDTLDSNLGTINKKIEGRIAFKNIWFAYTDEQYVLKNISFNIDPGKSLAIVGATGAGKSSIINILSRLYAVNKGEILIDGISQMDYELQHLRRQIAVVLQDVFLFSGSIIDNIRLYQTDISEDEIKKAAEKIGAHHFIEQLPGQYHYKVMERGSTLSLGQRQLISFIRAMVFNPSVLILDEATSSVDTETELIIQRATLELLRGKTSIVIAHRLSTIKYADNILVMDKGEIIEQGNHTALLEKNGYYKELIVSSLHE